MNDAVKETLEKLLKDHGTSLCSDSNRLKGFLYDACPSYRKEINAITLAVQERLIAELKKGGISDISIHSLSSRLHNATGIDKALAEWSIKAWAEALGLGFPSNTFYCSFCDKSQDDVRHLIAGPTVFICDECIELCMDIIHEEEEQSNTLYCSFCGKSQDDVRQLIASQTTYICDGCVEESMDIIRENRSIR